MCTTTNQLHPLQALVWKVVHHLVNGQHKCPVQCLKMQARILVFLLLSHPFFLLEITFASTVLCVFIGISPPMSLWLFCFYRHDPGSGGVTIFCFSKSSGEVEIHMHNMTALAAWPMKRKHFQKK